MYFKMAAPICRSLPAKHRRMFCKFQRFCSCLPRRQYSDNSPKSLPLDGIRVLDVSRVLAGPYCTMILGDHGAEVIKVERPGSGDDTRSWGPPFCGTETAYFLSINRNKKSIAVDMKNSDGNQIMKELAKKCDVLVENYVPGKLAEMGLGFEHLHEIAPQLIYCSITGYGQTGPYATRAGYDSIASGMGGLCHITGPEDGDPCRVGVAMTDLSTGLYAFGAISSALLHRQRTGKGMHIDCNLLSTQIATLTHIASNYLNAGQEGIRLGTGHRSIVPYQAFKTSDGYLMIGAGNNAHFEVLCKVIEKEELPRMEKFSSNKLRVENRTELIRILSERFSEKRTVEWLAVFEGCGIPYGPINNIEQACNDEQVIHNQMIQEIHHPTAGHVRVPGPAVRYSDFDLTHVKHPPPLLGEHTDQVLQELLGYSKSDINGLRYSGAVA